MRSRTAPKPPRSDPPGTVEVRGGWGNPSDPVRDRAFAALRPTLPPGIGRAIIGPGLVRVEEAPPGRLPLVKGVLAAIGAELGRLAGR